MPTRTILSDSTKKVSELFSGWSAVGQVIEIQSHATLIIDETFVFSSCYFRLGDGASINVKGTASSATLVSLNSKYFTMCGTPDMWNGITVMPGNFINCQGSYIRDAGSGLKFPKGYNGTNNILKNTTFADNNIGIEVGPDFKNQAAANVNFTQCWHNTITQLNPLKYPSNHTANCGIHVDQGSTLGFGTSGGPRNDINSLPTGMVVGHGSYAMVMNTSFHDMVHQSNNPIDGTGIYVLGASLTVTKSGNNSATNCIFNHMPNAGIYVYGPAGGISVKYAIFANFTYGVKYANSAQTGNVTAEISNNTFNPISSKSSIYFERPPASGSIGNSSISQNIIKTTGVNSTNFRFIDIKGSSGALNTLNIDHDTITNPDNNFNVSGIVVTGLGNNYVVGPSNTIHYYGDYHIIWDAINMGTGPEYKSKGISFAEMPGDGNTIINNEVASNLSTNGTPITINDRSFIADAIYVSNANSTTVCSNGGGSTYSGIHYANHCGMGTPILSDNLINNARFGLLFQHDMQGVSSTTFATQTRSGNIWSLYLTPPHFVHDQIVEN
jgi:hypothetical protein